MRRGTKNKLWIGLLIIILVLTSAATTAYFYHDQIRQVRQEGKTTRQALEEEIEELLNRSLEYVLVYAKDIRAGQTIKESDLMFVGIEPSIKPEDAIEDKTMVIGQKAKFKKSKYTYVSMDNLYEASKLLGDIREVEFSYIKLPSKIASHDQIDLRLKFPSGQDYIVLAKKEIKDLDRLYGEDNLLKSETFWLHLDEGEIIRMGSAIVDAYMNGADFYVTKYVEPFIQDPSEVTYPENFPVLDMISKDRQLINQAQASLILEHRQRLEATLSDIFDANHTVFETPTLEDETQTPEDEALIVDHNSNTEEKVEEKTVEEKTESHFD